MMEIKLLAFGIAKDIVGGSSTTLQLPSLEPTVADIKRQLAATYPQFSKLNSLAIAVNEEYAPDEAKVSAHDEIVIIPPVSGG